jgi:Zn finger protein HypA/HybF involved in hydrogenase expression
MHELSIALRIVELVEEQLADEPPGTTVSAVDIRIGDLSSVVSEALHFAWEPATEGTRLAGAALRISGEKESDALQLIAIEVNDPPSLLSTA